MSWCLKIFFVLWRFISVFIILVNSPAQKPRISAKACNSVYRNVFAFFKKRYIVY